VVRILIGVLLASLAAAQPVHILFDRGSFRVEGWSPPSAPGDWAAVFSVFAGSGDTPMLGSYAVESGSLVFHPRFPPATGVRYRAVLRIPGSPPIEAAFDGPPRPSPTTEVAGIYPSSPVLPANTLKLYVVFTAPMSRGEAYRHLRLLDENGKERELVFLEIQQELWDRDYQRLTVLFNPGRIKRGLVPNREDGPPLEKGRRYTFVVDQEWHDARGAELRAGAEKRFTVGPADRTPPEPKQWKIATPRAGTRDPLVADFGKPMDFALLQRLVDVPGVAGSVAFASQEREWRFTPEQPWKAGAYRIEVDTALEDLSGNGVGRPFDIDVFNQVTKTIERKTVSVPFRIRQ
jgi:hypothetical protein